MRILIKNAFIITQNKKRENISKGFIIVKNNKFEDIGSEDYRKEDTKKFDKIIDARNLVVLPGLINSHVHLGESIFEDFFTEKHDLESYLKITDELSKKTDLIEKGRKIIAEYSLLNLIKNGTTTICGGRTFNFADRLGIRNVSGYMLMNSFKLKNFLIDIENNFKREYKKIEKSKFSYPALFVHSLNTIDQSLLKNVKRILKRYPKIRLILHVAETKKQEQEIKNKFRRSSIAFVYRNKLLNKNTILVHGNWINDSDLKIIEKNGASIVHCLSSNLNVADKTLDLKKMIKNKISLCLATDGLVTSGTFSVLDEAGKCFIYHNQKLKLHDGSIPFQKILDLITIKAAKVLGLDNVVGSIEKGKKADLIFIKKEADSENIIDEIIKRKKRIFGVIIDGKIKVWNNCTLMIDEKKVEKMFRTLKKRIKESI